MTLASLKGLGPKSSVALCEIGIESIAGCSLIARIILTGDAQSLDRLSAKVLGVIAPSRLVGEQYVSKATLSGLVPMLPVRSMARSVEFYVQKMGFSVEKRNDHWGWAMLCLDGCRLMVDQSLNVDPDAPRQSVLYLYPCDVVQYHERVRDSGLSVPDLQATFYGMKEFRIADPDGNRMWIGERMSSAKQASV